MAVLVCVRPHQRGPGLTEPRLAGVPPSDGVTREFVPEHDGTGNNKTGLAAAAQAIQTLPRDMEHWHANRYLFCSGESPGSKRVATRRLPCLWV
jgi:hypothetical protein